MTNENSKVGQKSGKTEPVDSYLHKGLRKKLVEALRTKGITDENVLKAIEAIPRHYFVDPVFEHRAYEDSAFPISAEQTISQPFTVAFQTKLLEIKKFDKVLEVGTGSAFQSCVLAELGVQLFTIERQKALYDIASDFFYLKKYPNIKRFYGNGFDGLPSFAPFDKVLITCGAPFIPPKLIEQLKPGGIMVIPVGEGKHQKMLRIVKDKNGNVTKEEKGSFSFVPMLEGKNNSKI